MSTPYRPPANAPIDEFFKAGGIISRNMPGYEERPGQIEMARAVHHALSLPSHALIEAPCGIGKSYAYIIPAAIYARDHGVKVVVSTNTKTLQEQIRSSDMPTIAERYGLDIRYKILKGKTNYICLRKLYDIKKSGIPLDLFGEYAAEKVKLRTDAYLDAMTEIDRKNLSEFEEISHECGGDTNLWRMLACQSIDCVGGNCEYFKSCNYFRAVLDAQKCDLVIVNHALYFACLMLEANDRFESAAEAMADDEGAAMPKGSEKAFMNPIPPHTRVIFDEAHHLADVAQSAFSISCSLSRFGSALNQVNHTLRKSLGKKAKKTLDRVAEQKTAVEEKIKLYFNYAGMAVSDEMTSKKAEESSADDGQTMGLAKQLLFNPRHLGKISANPNSPALVSAVESLSTMAEEVGELLAEKSAALNMSGVKRVLSEIVTGVDFWNRVGDLGDDYVLWGTLPWQSAKNGSFQDIELIASPVDVARILSSELFSTRECAILTSATLTTENKFDYIKRETGIGGFEPIELILDSPYDIENQTGFIIPPVEANPKDRNFNEAVARWVQDIITHSEGRTLVLFTSKYLMDFVHREIALKMKLDGYEVLAQGQLPRAQLLKKFRDDVNSSLLALDSFWEGIDVRGESLSTLVITKLPFKVPSHPLNEARDNFLRRKNRDPFSESSLPWTILKLKQGIGRLIRHQTDRGVLVILDVRLRDTGYGRRIINALPRYRPIKKVSDIKVFLENRQ